MSRRSEGARLYLRARAGREPIYVIRDGAREISTGCGQDRRGEADRALAAHIAGKYVPAAAPDAGLADILIADVVTAYLTEHAPTTASAQFIAHTANPILDWWGAKTLDDVRRTTCHAYVAWRTAQAVANTAKPRRDGSIPTPRLVSEATARHELKTLRAAIRHWHAERPLPAVPVVTMPAMPEARDRWLTRAEVAAALRQALRGKQSRHNARMLLIGVYTGTRPGATRRLSWLPSTTGGWIDIERGVMYRRGADERRSKKRQTPVRLPERLLAHLRRWRRMDMLDNPPPMRGVNKGRKQPVTHVVHYYGKPIAKPRRSWATMMRTAGVGDDATPHVLRHTAATWLMQAGCDIALGAGFLGMTAATFEAVYGHHHPDFQHEAANAVANRNRAKR